MFKKCLLAFSILWLSACGAPAIHNQSGIAEVETIYVISEDLIGFYINTGSIVNHIVVKEDLMINSTKVLTSQNTTLQGSDVLEIIAVQGRNKIEIKNADGELIYSDTIYLSAGQTTTIIL